TLFLSHEGGHTCSKIFRQRETVLELTDRVKPATSTVRSLTGLHRPVSSCGRFRIGVANEAESGLPHSSSAPQKRSQKLKNQQNTNQVDGKYAGDAIAAELFGDPAAGRCDELRPCDCKVCKCHWGDEHASFADGTNCFICTHSGHTDCIVPG